MKLDRLNTLIAALISTTFGLLGVAKPTTAANLTGLTPNNTLINFDSSNPSVTTNVKVTGLDANANLLDIDYRPANGLLYGLTDTNNIYTINRDTGAAGLVSTLSTPFSGGVQSGVDFNPRLDRLRVVGSNDQNFSVNVDTGETAVQTPLAFAAGDPNAGVSPSITAVAYTNSFAGSPDPSRTTQLIDIDYDLNIFAPQLQPPNGILITGGSSNFNIPSLLGFDIFFDANGDNIVFTASNSNLFSLNLSNPQGGVGSETRIGSSDSDISFIGLAAEPIPAPVPEPSSVLGMLTLGAIGAVSLRKRQKQNVQP